MPSHIKLVCGHQSTDDHTLHAHSSIRYRYSKALLSGVCYFGRLDSFPIPRLDIAIGDLFDFFECCTAYGCMDGRYED